MSVKQKYIGNSPLLGSPEKSIAFKLKDGSVSYNKLSPGLREAVDSLEGIHEDMDDIRKNFDNTVKQYEQEVTTSLNGNMNALLDMGIYKQCFIGRPAGSVEGEYYTLETLDGDYAGDSGTSASAAMLEISNRVATWCMKVSEKPEVDIMHNLSQLEELLSKTGEYNYMNYLYPEKYSTETGAQTFTSFVKRVPKGKYTIKVKVWPSSTGNRDELPLPTALPDIVVTFGGVGRSLRPSSANVADYIRTQLDAAASCEATFTLDTQETAEGDVLSFSIESKSAGYNWFVYTFNITAVQGLAWDEYKIIPQMCISHKTSDIYKRVLYSCEADLPVEKRRFEPPFTLYPEYTSFDAEYEEIQSGWDKIINAATLIDILKSRSDHDNEAYVVGNRVPVTEITDDHIRVATDLINGNGQTVSTIPIRLGSANAEVAGLLSAADKVKYDNASTVSEGLDGRVTAIENLIDTDHDAVIDKFNEIVDFLEHIAPGTTLEQLIEDLHDYVDDSKVTDYTVTANPDSADFEITLGDGQKLSENLGVPQAEGEFTDYNWVEDFTASITEDNTWEYTLSNEGQEAIGAPDNMPIILETAGGTPIINCKFSFVDHIVQEANSRGKKYVRISNSLSVTPNNATIQLVIIKNKGIVDKITKTGSGSFSIDYPVSQLEGNHCIVVTSYRGRLNQVKLGNAAKAGVMTYIDKQQIAGSIYSLSATHNPDAVVLSALYNNGESRNVSLQPATSTEAGVMLPADKTALGTSVQSIRFEQVNDAYLLKYTQADVAQEVAVPMQFADTTKPGIVSVADMLELNKVSDLVDALGDYASGYQLEVQVDTPVVLKGSSPTVNITIHYPHSFPIPTITKLGTQPTNIPVEETVVGNTYHATVALSNLTENVTFRVNATLRDVVSAQKDVIVKAVDPIFYGFGNNWHDGGWEVKPATDDFHKVYTDTDTTGGYFHIFIPTSLCDEDLLTTHNAEFTVGGVSVEMTSTLVSLDNQGQVVSSGGTEYRCYQTQATYPAGTALNVVVLDVN